MTSGTSGSSHFATLTLSPSFNFFHSTYLSVVSHRSGWRNKSGKDHYYGQFPVEIAFWSYSTPFLFIKNTIAFYFILLLLFYYICTFLFFYMCCVFYWSQHINHWIPICVWAACHEHMRGDECTRCRFSFNEKWMSHNNKPLYITCNCSHSSPIARGHSYLLCQWHLCKGRMKLM